MRPLRLASFVRELAGERSWDSLFDGLDRVRRRSAINPDEFLRTMKHSRRQPTRNRTRADCASKLFETARNFRAGRHVTVSGVEIDYFRPRFTSQNTMSEL